MQIICGDIGGTHARFALADIASGGDVALGDVATFATQEHVRFEDAWEEFRKSCGGTLPNSLALAVAGSVTGNIISFTNNDWTIALNTLRDDSGMKRLTILNDFAAIAHHAARAEDADLVHLAGPEQCFAGEGTISVLGPGTGLGVAHLHRDGHGGYHVQASEGGHVDFAPVDDVDDALLAHLRRRYDRVSAERVASGPAIVDICKVLAKREGATPFDLSDVEIWNRGLEGSDDLAAAAVDRFCMILGSIAGDVALTQGGWGGVAIAGGLGLRLCKMLQSPGFAARFSAKGRYADLMRSIPVKLVAHPQPGLTGAAAAFCIQHPEACA
ncbi:glucokinase [Pseudopontixanthobacter vadosimaris]|uniref:glucokinase n=1 Tax=Pseudopontixanthobacter vadosimaris TaxID=2726450 RepID=UPI001473F89E|nr:glucokinase [Pseudopontixanthobacter vadosimaris]